jgi:uncharacterized membrane protein
MLALIIIIDVTVMLTALIFAVTPYITRRTECFGVSVPESEYENELFRGMRRSHAVLSTCIGVVSAIITSLLFMVYGEDAIWIVSVIFIELGALFLVYYMFHRRVARYKQNAGWEDNASTRVYVPLTGKGGGIDSKMPSPLWFFLYGAVIIAGIAVTWFAYGKLPDMIPVHFDISGTATRYAEKSLASVLYMPATQIFIAVIFWFTYIMVIKAKRMIDPENPEESAARLAAFRAAWCFFAIFGGLLLVASLGVLNIAIIGLMPVQLATVVLLAVTIAIVAWTMYLAFKYGQGGSRLDKDRSKGTALNPLDDDRRWIAGILYFNREDPSLFVEKRFGVGFTMNLARPAIWGIFLAILAACVGLTLFATKI